MLRPARLQAYRDALAGFVESRDEAEWIREEDREPLAFVRGLVFGRSRAVRGGDARRALARRRPHGLKRQAGVAEKCRRSNGRSAFAGTCGRVSPTPRQYFEQPPSGR